MALSRQACNARVPRKPYTPEQFAAGLETMRPGLIKYACRMRPCQEEDAEDLVQEAARLALLILERFDFERSSLVTWMNGILKIVILRDREKHLSEPCSVPLIHAIPVEARPSENLRDAMRPQIDRLPQHLRDVVHWHLDGFTQVEIAGGLGLGINTVANRIALAGQQLKIAFVDFEDEWDSGWFDYCARHARYQAQNSMGKYWRNLNGTAARDWRRRMRCEETAAEKRALKRR